MLTTRLKLLLSILIVTIVALSASWVVLAQSEESPRTTLVLADISSNPAKKINRFQPLADYLAAQLSDYGFESGEVIIAPDLETMVGWIADGEVDMYFDSLFPATIVMQETGAEPILSRWKDGLEEYNSVIFALADSGYETAEDLQGAMVAFDSPDSTSGFLLPSALLIDMELQPVEKPSASSSVAEDEVGYVFSGDDENSIQWLFSRKVSAAVVDSGGFMEIPEETREHLVILAETRSVPRQLAILRPGFDPEIRDAMIAIMLEMPETEEGQAVLEKFKTSQFGEFPEGTEVMITEMEELVDVVLGTDTTEEVTETEGED